MALPTFRQPSSTIHATQARRRAGSLAGPLRAPSMGQAPRGVG